MDLTVTHTPANATVDHTPAVATVAHVAADAEVVHTAANATVTHNEGFAIEYLTDDLGERLTDDNGVELAAWFTGHPATVEVN